MERPVLIHDDTLTSVVHIVLFLVRCVYAYRTRFWERVVVPCPSGEFAVELRFKFRRQENTHQ